MEEAYDYWTIRVAREAARDVRAFLANDLAGVAERAGGGATLLGAWAGAGSIGWYDDEFVALVGSPPKGFDPFAGLSGIVDTTLDRVRATARPSSPTPLPRDGVFAHRWFEFASADWDEFLELSVGAWPAFEGAYGATIQGFFRSRTDDDQGGGDGAPPATATTSRVLLLTRYPSLAAWQESRGTGRSDAPADVAESGRRFLRRRELTRRSVVRTAWLL